MKLPIFFLCIVLSGFCGRVCAQSEEDQSPFPLGPLGAMAFQQRGTSMVKVTSVTAGGPADVAGVKTGDYIYGANNERLPLNGVVHTDGWRGAVSELGYAIERSQSSGGALSLQILRAGTGALSLNLTLPEKTAWRISYPLGDVRMREYFDKVCADLHSKVQASADGNFEYDTGFLGMILLGHPDWDKTTGARPYRNSINKLKNRCVTHLAGRILEPVENTLDCSDTGYENWDICASAMFLGEYRRKTGAGDTAVNAAVQRSAEMIANRIQNYPQLDNNSVMHQKLGRMGHCGVVGDYPHAGLLGLNIINAHAAVSLGILRGAGANFGAASGTSGMTIDQKFQLSWTWLKSCTNISGGDADGNIGYGGIQTDSYDSAARTAGTAAGYEIYRAAGGTAPAGNDLDRLNRMKAYVPRSWPRQQHAHAYTLGGVAFSQMLMPFLGRREQRYFQENSRFFHTLSRNPAGEVLYFPGRALGSGDNKDRTRYIMPGLTWAVASGNLPSFPQPAGTASRVHVRMNSPRNDWPQLTARRVKVTGLTQNLDLDLLDYQGNVIPATGYFTDWSQVSGANVIFAQFNTLDNTVTFPAAGNYRLQMSVNGADSTYELFDFEVSTTTTPPDTTATVTQHPVSRHFLPGDTAVLNLAVTGGGPFVYQWKLDGENFGESQTSPALSLTNLSAASAGVYQCTIWHPGGQVSSNPCQLCLAGTMEPVAGGLKREVWNNTTGVTVANLTGNSRYPRCPDITGTVLEAEAPRDFATNYGQRLSGWVVPPVTGNYTFYLATNDAGELWLSTDDAPANKQKIAEVTVFTAYRAWDGAPPSAAIALTAGTRYYIEALQVDGGGGTSHLSIAWRKPGDPVPANGSAPIPGTFLQGEFFHPYPGFEELVSWWPMDETTGTAARDVMSTANEGNLTGPVWAAGKRGGALVFDGNDKVQCSNLGALGGLSMFTAAAWVKVNAGNNQEGVIVQQRMATNTTGNGQYQLLVNAAGKVRFFCYGDDLDQFNFTGTTSINDGQWHHVAGVRDGFGGGRIYVDGVLNGSVSGTTMRNLKTETTIAIGADTRDNINFFRGSIDDVRIYRCALAPSQITALASAPGRWTASAWTGDSTAGIIPGTAWAYHFGATTTATIAGQTVTGLASFTPSAAGKFSISGPTAIYNNDSNFLIFQIGTGSAAMARDFIYGGNPSTITLQGLTAGRNYVATILSVGWEAAGLRRATFTSGSNAEVIDQNKYGNDYGLRVDYSFAAEAATRTITIAPVTANTFHLYALALRQGYIVTNDCDFGPGSLRQALADAALAPGADVITFDPSLNGARIDCLSDLVINDTGGVTVDATGLVEGVTLSGRGGNRIFHVMAGASLTCRRLNLINGRTFGPFPGNYGGGILAQGALSLTECSLSGCVASTAGGAIAALGSIQVNLDRCSLTNNSAAYGGAVQNEATMVILTSTFARNSATNAGGAISAPFGRSTQLKHCTVSANTAGVSGGAYDGTGLTLENSIAAGNSAPAGPNINGALAGSAGVNLTSGSPLLTPLGNYGGFTLTMLPMPGSAAINAAGSTLATAPTDQRGLAREGTPDIGAAEFLGGSDLTRFWTDDWDGDGVANGLEFALGTNPQAADPGSLLYPRNGFAGDGRIIVEFGYNAAFAGRVRWVLEYSDNLGSWSEAFYRDTTNHFAAGFTGTLNGNILSVLQNGNPPQRRYFRFKAEVLP